MKIAAAYVRVSTERQDEYSLDSQLKLIRDYAQKNGYSVPDEFVFIEDGISGRSAEKRPQFMRMVGWAKEKDCPFSAILVWKFSRFARNQEESIVYKSMLSRSGIEVISISEPLAEGPFGSLIERILEWMDEFYSIRLSGEVKRGMAEKVSRGEIVTIPSFGYDIQGKTYVPNADAALVRQIYADYLAGKPVISIARSLGNNGIRTRRGNLPDNRFVDYILANPVYIGKIRWSKDGKSYYGRGGDTSKSYLADGLHEPIIDLDTWNAVQARRERLAAGRQKFERRDQPVDWMLKGLMRCSSCGSTLVFLSTACPSVQCHKYSRGVCKTSHSISIAKANAAVIAALENSVLLSSFPLAPHTVPPTPASTDYAKLINLEQAKLRRVQEAYECGIDTIAEYADKKKKVLAAIEKLQKEAAAEQPAPVFDVDAFRSKVIDVLSVLKSPSASEQAKNSALKSVVSYIVYEKAHSRLAVYYYI